jgi:hypothetical protein
VPSPAPAPGTNLALGGTATASSSAALAVAANVVDGKLATVWQPVGSAEEWIEVKLPQAKTVRRIAFSEVGAQITSYRVEYVRGGAWVRLQTGSTVGANKAISFSGINTDRVRLVVVKSRAPAAIAEFQLY